MVLLGNATFGGPLQTAPGLSLKERFQQRVKVTDENMPSKAEMDSLPSVSVAEGKNRRPVGEFRLRTYRIVELRLTRPLRAEIAGRETQVDRAWRITITGGPFEVRNMPAIIWVNDAPIGIGLEAPDLRSISIITFDSEVIRNGASVGFSYGVTDTTGYTVLPERITLAASGNRK